MDKVYGFAEYALSALFIFGGFNVFFAEPEVLPGIFAVLVGQASIPIYAVLFMSMGFALLYGKIRKNKKVHKHSLLVMYLTCLYVLVLSLAITGITTGVITTLVSGMAAACLWVRWKFKTEYISRNEFKKEILELTD